VTGRRFVRLTVTGFTDWAITVDPALAWVVSIHVPAMTGAATGSGDCNRCGNELCERCWGECPHQLGTPAGAYHQTRGA
jgi:hypothetical protein